jgi:glycerol-3-phosphate O-acyltransferase
MRPPSSLLGTWPIHDHCFPDSRGYGSLSPRLVSARLPSVQTAPALVAPPRGGGFLGRLLAPFFAKVRIDADATERLRDAYERGIVVHCFRSHRVLDPTFLLYALDRLNLPPPAWMHDHYLSQLAPTVEDLAATVKAGAPSLLFLRRPRTLISPNPTYAERYFETLIALQQQLDRPILLLPEALLGTKQPVGLRRTIVDTIFGDREAPGRLRELMGFFWWYDTARFHVGAPVDIRAVLEREEGKPERVIAKKIRWSILHHLSREDRVRTGPLRVSPARTRDRVLQDPEVRREIEEVAQKESRAAVEKKAESVLKTMAADLRYGWIRVVDASLDIVWRRIYGGGQGIIVDAEGLKAVRNAARKGPLVLVPSHKSHIDYLVMSQIFFKEGIAPPMIAAGENLNFWPLGLIFRRSGAFFLRRSFKGDRLYSVLFAAYVRRLLKEGNTIEFFIEGGRSRTGKILPPKMGMLSMCVDPVLDAEVPDVHFVPASIGYEKVIEAKSYWRELEGDQKKREDAVALLGSSTKVLRSKYGRVFVDFAEPISLRVFATSRSYEIGAERSKDEPDGPRRQLVTQLAHRIVYAINQATRVTPTSIAAMVLLSRGHRGLGEEELHKNVDRFLELLQGLGARCATSLEPPTRRPAIREAIGRFAADGLIGMVPAPDGDTVLQMNEAGRLALDYYKNNILHFFVPYAVVALSVMATPSKRYEEVAETARHVSRLLKFEFSFRGDRGFEENLRQAAAFLEARRTLEIRTGEEGELWSITLVGAEEAQLLANMLGVFFEAYRLTAECLDELPAAEKKLTASVLVRAKKQILEGRIARAESANKLTVASAIKLLTEEGIISREGGNYQLADDEKRSALIERLSHYLATMA